MVIHLYVHIVICFKMYYLHYYLNRPTFKTATPTSRTQLKLQLQREQQQQMMIQQQTLDTAMDPKMHLLFGSGQGLMESEFIDSGSTSACGSGSSSLEQMSQLVQMDNLIDSSSGAKLKVPLQSIGVDVPPQVLQVYISWNKNIKF